MDTVSSVMLKTLPLGQLTSDRLQKYDLDYYSRSDTRYTKNCQSYADYLVTPPDGPRAKEHDHCVCRMSADK